jgi:hypothetical protein
MIKKPYCYLFNKLNLNPFGTSFFINVPKRKNGTYYNFK